MYGTPDRRRPSLGRCGRDGQEPDTGAGLVALYAGVACDGCNRKPVVPRFHHQGRILAQKRFAAGVLRQFVS
jgi:hypothetical protein